MANILSRLVILALSTIPLVTSVVIADDSNPLTDMSIEDLMQIDVTSVSKKEQSISQSAAAIYVLTNDDIRRSGATMIPEVLKLVPGLDVFRVDGNRWAISARGSSDLFSNKLLVLIDGRSVYTPLFSGVYWDVQNTPLEDIERIEVIRGPGALLWGANAVNGVINIITKSANDTKGGLVSGGGGNYEQGAGGMRYGTEIGDIGAARAYGMFFNRSSTNGADGEEPYDAWRTGQVGFRSDLQPTKNDQMTLQGDAYKGNDGMKATQSSRIPPYYQTDQTQTDISGGNILGRWEHQFESGSVSAIQAFFDHADRSDLFTDSVIDTYDIDSQYRFSTSTWNEVTLGAEYRSIVDRIHPNGSLILDPDSRQTGIASGFLQNEITTLNNSLHITFGSKFEHNEYTGMEIQPSARVAWLPSGKQTLWTAISRAARTPSRAENDISYPVSINPGPSDIPIETHLQGNQGLESEKLIAYELGHRYQASSELSFDTALFFNDYTSLGSLNSLGVQPVVTDDQIVLNNILEFGDSASGHAYGGEFVVNWQATSKIRFQGWYAYLNANFDSAENAIVALTDKSTPKNQASLRSTIDLPHDLELDSQLRYVGPIDEYDIDSYFELDTRIGWNYSKQLEFSVAGRNLLHDQHQEFVSRLIMISPTDVPRSVYGKVTWRFN